jgi:hypothetical protein
MEVLASLAVERASPGYLLAEARIQMKNEGRIMAVLASLDYWFCFAVLIIAVRILIID